MGGRKSVPQRNINTSGLRPWQKGQSGNPGGRPRRQPVTEALRSMLEEPALMQKAHKDMTVAERLALKLLKMAMDPKKKLLGPMVEVMDRVEGKARQRVENTGADGGPMQFEIPGTREEVERRIAELLKKAKGGNAG